MHGLSNSFPKFWKLRIGVNKICNTKPYLNAIQNLYRSVQVQQHAKIGILLHGNKRSGSAAFLNGPSIYFAYI